MIWRTILGIVLGDVIFAGGSALLLYASKMDPHALAPTRFIVLSSLTGIVMAVAGGFVAGWIGRRADLICGLILAVIIAGGAIASIIGRLGQGAIWPQLATLLLMAPAALAGDWLRMRKTGK
jgi:MFS family permease